MQRKWLCLHLLKDSGWDERGASEVPVVVGIKRTQLTLVTVEFGSIRENVHKLLGNFGGQQIIGREE